MGLGAAAGALLVALGVLGAPPGAGAELSGVFQQMFTAECYFTNGTEKVRYVQRYFYNRQMWAMFDSDVGHFVGFTPYGERVAKRWNSNPVFMERERTAVDWLCRHNYEIAAPFSVERRVPPSVSISLVPPSSSQPGPGRLLCSVMDFYPAEIQVRWFQGEQELSEHVVATDVVPNGDWTYQLLVLLETPPRRGLSYSCQVEHVSLEQPLRRHWEMAPDAARSKMLTGIGAWSWARSSWRWGSASTCARRAREPAAAAAPPRGLGPGRDPPLRPRSADSGGVPCPPQRRWRSAPAQCPLPALPIKLPSWARGQRKITSAN
ncbi:class II histocompatibility antigen, B-L beta chain-like [Zonotrichia leucophrys gambelii]|uniref:class II histocompatibility antigen, B-L beta chain-like n=1 Tax=Zonotrichia leucophrys gambelii TaxID=257770 RepID=UPI00313FFBDE